MIQLECKDQTTLGYGWWGWTSNCRYLKTQLWMKSINLVNSVLVLAVYHWRLSFSLNFCQTRTLIISFIAFGNLSPFCWPVWIGKRISIVIRCRFNYLCINSEKLKAVMWLCGVPGQENLQIIQGRGSKWGRCIKFTMENYSNWLFKW